MDVVINSLLSAISIYSLLLIVRVLLTWFPQIDWYSQPFRFLREISDPYLDLFRSLIPPIGGWDLSPMLAIFVLQLISGTLVSLAQPSF
ncbi:MAG: YggT family protein [Pseudanabaenaceae cyanobacterium SKYGB_i_bin29]|nr:YggT family protein [Pseudanabaenaceae cyanobacterium SKYG29]MDW8420965.1 YggT family protein [Pseudanabaenaceae cyanobacterium SKYGB_i_bin29]